jgi:hypothetical protein
VNFEGFLFWCFGVLKFSIFFLSFWGLQFFVWSFTREEKGYLPFFLWPLRVFCYSILKFQSLQFYSCHFVNFHLFIVRSFLRGERGYLPFFLWTLKVLCFGILKFWSFEVDGMNKYPVVLGY